MQPIRLAIVDDHQMVRRGLECLADGDPELEVIGSLDSRDAAVAFLRTNVPDVLLVDLSLQAGSGLELIQDVVARKISTRMLVVSMHDERLFGERCLRAGAHGYVCKTRSWSEIRRAIVKTAQGETAVSPELSQQLLRRNAAKTTSSPFGLDQLSAREFSIYEAIGRGMTVKDVAGQMHLSPKTVESYRDRIRNKLGIGSALELTRHATVWSLQSAAGSSAGTTPPSDAPGRTR